MVIVLLWGGLANQMNQYSMGRLLAHKLNTELKLDLSWCPTTLRVHTHYRLGAFNIHEVFATPEEIKHVKETGKIPTSAKDIENIQGDIYIQGHWMHNPNLYKDISDIIKKEFTLKKPFNPNAEAWHQKILSAECSVSMHFRHGDFAYNPKFKGEAWCPILPLDYYYTCLDILKQQYSNPTVFVFSDNLQWVKENLRLDVPTEFVEGCETDDEELVLMSLCKHNIIPSSTFSRQAAWLNQNPDKKIFGPAKSTAKGVEEFLATLTPKKKDTILKAFNPEFTNRWIWIPYDFDNQPEITQQPIFSLLLVVNNNATNLSATLDSFLGQDYKYYEVVIIDNASTDGSDKICQDAIKNKANVTYKRLNEQTSNAKAWNEAFKIAQGKYVLFLKVGDQFLTNTLTTLYLINERREVDIIHMFSWLKKDEKGNVVFADKKFSTQCDERFTQAKNNVINSANGYDASRLLFNQQINSFLGTKLYNYGFLTENKIKFDESLDDKAAEFSFQTEAFSKSTYFIYVANAFYIAPVVNNAISGGGYFYAEFRFVSSYSLHTILFSIKESSLKNSYKASEEIPSSKIFGRRAA